jgi:uncharacterized protein YndB with AHSA1/START domain
MSDVENPFVIERVYQAARSRVWSAITDKSEMKSWYFDLAEFIAEPGFEFSFYGGTEEKQYLHRCIIKEVIPQKKLSYSWRYDGYAGDSLVTFELFETNTPGETRLRLTHEGLDTFPLDNPDLRPINFKEGWTHIIGTALKEYLVGVKGVNG